MKQLLIVAHGSRKESSNNEIRSLSEKVSGELSSNVNKVSVAFLELASPSIQEGIDDCFNSGVEEIIVLPYFLAGGNHVLEDIPREIRQALNNWPEKNITILPHIGANEGMCALLAKACKS